MNIENVTFFYGLTDPDTGQVMYVGKSDDPQKRLIRHVYEALYKLRYESYAHSPKETWIILLAMDGKFPGMEILGQCHKDDWRRYEDELIEYWQSKNGELLNTKRVAGMGGGDGKKTESENLHWACIKKTMKMLGARPWLLRQYRRWVLTLGI